MPSLIIAATVADCSLVWNECFADRQIAITAPRFLHHARYVQRRRLRIHFVSANNSSRKHEPIIHRRRFFSGARCLSEHQSINSRMIIQQTFRQTRYISPVRTSSRRNCRRFLVPSSGRRTVFKSTGIEGKFCRQRRHRPETFSGGRRR